ncbi:MAG: hypothetical protein ACOYYS_20435 [Chloroflexota bacterium]
MPPPIERLITIPEAIKKYGLTEAGLRKLTKVGKIRAGILSSGEVVVNEQDAQAQKPTAKEELPEYEKNAHLKGQAISVNEGSRKYEISSKTLSRWVKAGIIKRLSEDGYRVFVDEADVAYCAEVYRQHGGQGKRLFNKDGTPYHKSEARKTNA